MPSWPKPAVTSIVTTRFGQEFADSAIATQWCTAMTLCEEFAYDMLYACLLLTEERQDIQTRTEEDRKKKLEFRNKVRVWVYL